MNEIIAKSNPQAWDILSNIHARLLKESSDMASMFVFVTLSHSNPRLYPVDIYNRTPLYYAAAIRCREVLQYYLVNNIYDVNAVDCLGETALSNAIQLCSLPSDTSNLIDLLIHGANPNLHAYDSPTPLMRAVLKENEALVANLLMAGANPYIRFKEQGLFLRKGDTALSLATRLNTLDCSNTSGPVTKTQMNIIRILVNYTKSKAGLIFHALQQTTNPILKNYILDCMHTSKNKKSKSKKAKAK